MSEKVQERALEIAKDFQEALDKVKGKREVIKKINEKITGCRKNLQSYRDKETELLAKIEELEAKFTESLSSDKDSHEIHQKKIEAGQRVERYREMIAELEKKVLPQLKRDLQAAEEDAREALNREWVMLRSDYQEQLNKIVEDTVVLELLAWRQAYNDVGKGLEISVYIQPLRIKNFELEKALL